jgi:hypothetical protein
MARPGTPAPKEIIIPIFTQWEKVGSVTSILAELEDGLFYNPALLMDQFMRDDRLRGVWDIAVQAVLGMPMHMESADHSAKKRSDKVSDAAQKNWSKMVPRSELIELLFWGFFLGAGVARKNWVRTPASWLPVIDTWHAGALRFDRTTDTYMLRTQDQGEIPIRRDDPDWVLFTPWGHKYGRLRCYLMSASMMTLERSWTRRDRARHSEKHGMPIAQLIVPSESDQQDKDTMRKASAALGTETTSVTPQGTEGNKYDWKFHEPAKSSSEVFGGTLQEIGDSMAILLLGQQMSTTGSTGLGSDKNPGDVVRRDKMRFYAECIGDVGQDGVLDDWADYNYGDAELAPRPVIEVDPPEDGQKKATELSTLGDAVDKLEKYGADVRTILEEAGVPMLTAEQQKAAMKQRQDAQPSPPAIPGAPGDGGDPANQPSDDPVATPAGVG